MRAAGLVLAAGAGERFGGQKLLARIDGGPVLGHVVAAAREAGLEPLIVVAGTNARRVAEVVEPAPVVVNPEPEAGLAGSLHLGIAAIAGIEPPIEAVVVLLGDQPLVDPEVIRALVARLKGEAARPVAVPRFADGGGANPVALARPAFGLVAEASGDRGLGPILAAHPGLVAEVEVPGANPDIDTIADLAAVAEAAWARRVIRDGEQVERIREVPDGPDFYAGVSAVFRADPDRRDDPVLDALRRLARPGDTWLDIGAGAGRYALPLARTVRRVIAIDPSPGMLGALREDAAAHAIANLDVVEGRWPDDMAAVGPLPCADVALMAHVGADVEAIGPFLEAMERAARRTCVAVLMERPPAAAAEPFWPPVHGEARVQLPALPAFVDLLAARGRQPRVERAVVERRRWPGPADLERFLRRQLWIAPGGPKDPAFRAAFADLVVIAADGSASIAGSTEVAVGVVTWAPPVSSAT